LCSCDIWIAPANALKAKRLNHARKLLAAFDHLPDAVAQMVKDCGLSPRQVYRYLQQARRLKQPVPIADAKIAFTVKLSQKLVGVFALSRTAGLSLSEIVSRALLQHCRSDEGVAKRAILDGHAVHFEYRFDRLLPQKVAQVYELLVPEIRARLDRRTKFRSGDTE